jgi:hypothetical protein
MEMVCLYKPLGMIPMPLDKEAFDYRNRYVCTEKDDQEIIDDIPDWCPLPRPNPPAPECKYKTALEACNGAVDDAARAATLAAYNEIDEWAANLERSTTRNRSYGDMRRFIKSLEQQAGDPEHIAVMKNQERERDV